MKNFHSTVYLTTINNFMLQKSVFILLISLFSLIISGASAPTQAHQSVTSNNLNVVIHISPDDQPIALQMSRITIEVTDPTNAFNFKNCDCVLMIKNKGTVIAELPLLGEGSSIETSFTFADSGEHILYLKGKPNSEIVDQFSSFEHTFTIQVNPVEVTTPPNAQETLSESSQQPLLQLSIIVLSMLVILSVIISVKKRHQP
jgi:hypothetical protein